MMDLQRMLDEFSQAEAARRAKYHVTLGRLIDYLKNEPMTAYVVTSTGVWVGRLHSYRGYYSDLAFDHAKTLNTVEEVLKDAQTALTRTFEGYKGGDYRMTENTPLWVSEYGDASGMAVMDAKFERQEIDGIRCSCVVLTVRGLD